MTTEVGKLAEEIAVKYLQKESFVILAQNWRTRLCEIDIVARKTSREGIKKVTKIHFVEVKYRRSKKFGASIEYVTSVKLKQMKFAAEVWISENKWEGDYQLDVIGIDKVLGKMEVSYIGNVELC